MYAPRSRQSDHWARGAESESARRSGGPGHRVGPPSNRVPPRSRLGSLPGRGGLNIVLGSVGLGVLASIFVGAAPGPILGVCLLAGTVAAVLLVRPRAVHLIIPVPALAYFAASMVVGYIDDRAALVSHAALAIHAIQWLASGFLAVAAATALAIAMTVVAWRLRRQTRRAASGRDLQNRHAPMVDDSRSWDNYYRQDDRRNGYAPQDERGAPVRRGPRDRYGSTKEYGARNEYDSWDG
jgi:hypothetical protein